MLLRAGPELQPLTPDGCSRDKGPLSPGKGIRGLSCSARPSWTVTESIKSRGQWDHEIVAREALISPLCKSSSSEQLGICIKKPSQGPISDAGKSVSLGAGQIRV